MSIAGAFWLGVLWAGATHEPELPVMRASGPLAIRSVRAARPTVGRYELLELTLDVSAAYDNPFDPEQVDVLARFTTPGGKHVDVAGFFYQSYRNRHPDDDLKTPLLDASGPPCWKVRFTPTQVGRHTYRVSVRNRSKSVASAPGTFDVKPTGHHGFVRVCRRRPRYFAFDDGAPFVPVGQNLQNDWPRYDHSARLARAGCNAARPWVFSHWTWLEWSFKPDLKWAGAGHYMRSYAGAGRYNQRIAWIADHRLARWRQDGLHVILCLGAGELQGSKRYGDWGGNPWNEANGGFLAEPSAFWTDATARKLYKQRLRYIVARYGHSPAVWAWEFWNERGQETDAEVAWLAEMSEHLAAIDPNRHLITTSHWGVNAETAVRTWALTHIGFTQTHNYFEPDTIRRRTARLLALSPKPHVIGEGGGPLPRKDAAVDPTGTDFHNSLWAGLASGAAGPTLSWWWRDRIEPNDLFFHYTAIARFARSVPWTTEPLRPIAAHDVRVSMPSSDGGLRPVRFVPLGGGWGKRAERNRFKVGPDGRLDHAEQFGAVLFGKGRSEWANPPTTEVNYPAAGRFVVHVHEAARAVLEISLDGRVVLRDDSFDTPRTRFSRNVGIDVPAGRHAIRLRNTGVDWLRMRHILLTHYRDPARWPDVSVFGLRSERMAVLWLHHRLDEWAYREIGVKPQAATGATATVHGLEPGAYRVEWWDTRKGEVLATHQAACEAGVLKLTPPVIRTDAACIVRREP